MKREKMPWLGFGKASSADSAEVQRLLDQIDGATSDIRDAFMRQFEAVRARVDQQALAALLRDGRLGEAIDLVQRAALAGNATPLADAISSAVLAAGQAAALAMPIPTEMQISFGITNPKTIEALRTYEFGLIRQITDDTRSAIAEAVRAGVAAGRNPLDIARDVREFVGLTTQQTRAVNNFRRLLEDGKAEALDRALRDKRFDATIARAIADAKPLTSEQVDKMVQRYAERALKARSETIARTEAMRAVNFGNLRAWQQAVEDGVIPEASVRRKWWHSHDGLVRDAHISIPVMNADGVGLAESFKSPLGPILYPGDPDAEAANVINCRCTTLIRYVPPVR